MAKSLSVLRFLALGTALFAPSALASGWYVDAVNGNNANNGTSPSAAWRTITWAVAHAPALDETIHVAAGTYDVALGEVFPIEARGGQRLVGAARDAVLVGPHPAQGSIEAVVRLRSSVFNSFSPQSGWERMTLRGAYVGVLVQAVDGLMSPVLRDLAVLGGFEKGVEVVSLGGPRATPILERVDVRGAYIGLLVATHASDVIVRARDCTFADCEFAGARTDGAVNTYFDRCRFERNGAYGLWLQAPPVGQLQTAVLRDTLLAHNEGSAIEYHDAVPVGAIDVDLERCTLTGNTTANLHLAGAVQAVNVSIFDSILAGDGGDVVAAPGAQVLAANSLILDGFSNGINGCLSADPSFRAPQDGDFRLAFGSPCIDRGVQSPGVTLDLLGHARVVDGDLDLSRLCDLGAIESRPLDGPATVASGSVLSLEVSGELGATSAVFWSRHPLLNTPTQTPFGLSFLQQPLLFRVTTTAGATPSIVSRAVPPSPSLVGQSFSFQARTQSSAAPAGEAYTNPLSITIVP